MRKGRILISAGASGIGLAMTKAFLAEGYHVWVGDNDQAALDTLTGFHESLICSKLDVANQTEMATWFDQIEQQWQGVDIICVNAGIAGPTALLENVTYEAWQQCLNVNLTGAFLMTHYAVPLLKAQKHGALIYTSSTAGNYGYPSRSPYCASKWGINGLMKTAAMELGGFGIRANAICPGGVHGPRFQGVMEREAKEKGVDYDQIYQGYVAGVSMKTLVDAEDIAAMALFLASPAATKISGQIISVDGHTENPNP